MMLQSVIFLAALFVGEQAHALTAVEAKAIAIGDTDARIAALNHAMPKADERTAAFVQALSDDSIKLAGEQLVLFKDGKAYDPVTGNDLSLPSALDDITNNNRMRGELDNALAALKLFSKDPTVRAAAILELQGSNDDARLSLIEKALATESVTALKDQLGLLHAAMLLNSPDQSKRLKAATLLAQSGNPNIKTLLLERLKIETEGDVKTALQTSLRSVESSLMLGERLGQLFTGISLGSILLLVAVPVSFMTSALVGATLERSVIRFLYGRPLETLLATWGISLMLMQGVRSIFGAQNVGVENPRWMSGGLQVLGNLQLPYNRLVIIAFAAAVLLAMAWLIARTRLGLFVRGVTQNRAIASCMGVNTARIDTYAFALGSGIAGLAGCALSQIGNVGPDLGQGYIVDSFMVVVLGGVGQLAGTVYAAMGLGLLNKLLEGWTGAVLAKIAVLVFIIIFIQKRPQGIFAMKGRSAES